ncbi:hypothetical protein cypCar_00015526 [Cyprinus carpio]|nr:hypothetical protein cypCar_00015526 [Cyprinus carpio]
MMSYEYLVECNIDDDDVKKVHPSPPPPHSSPPPRPSLRVCDALSPGVSQLACVRSLWMSVVNIFITPLCTSVVRCCSGIHVVFSKE